MISTSLFFFFNAKKLERVGEQSPPSFAPLVCAGVQFIRCFFPVNDRRETRKNRGLWTDCIIEINLESHDLVQNIPHEPTNGGPSTQRTTLNVNRRSTEILFPFIYLLWIRLLTGVRTHPSQPPPPPPPPPPHLTGLKIYIKANFPAVFYLNTVGLKTLKRWYFTIRLRAQVLYERIVNETQPS